MLGSRQTLTNIFTIFTGFLHLCCELKLKEVGLLHLKESTPLRIILTEAHQTAWRQLVCSCQSMEFVLL